jgi:hypothetical protein
LKAVRTNVLDLLISSAKTFETKNVKNKRKRPVAGSCHLAVLSLDFFVTGQQQSINSKRCAALIPPLMDDSVAFDDRKHFRVRNGRQRSCGNRVRRFCFSSRQIFPADSGRRPEKEAQTKTTISKPKYPRVERGLGLTRKEAEASITLDWRNQIRSVSSLGRCCQRVWFEVIHLLAIEAHNENRKLSLFIRRWLGTGK